MRTTCTVDDVNAVCMCWLWAPPHRVLFVAARLRVRAAVTPAVVVRQRKPWRRKNGVFLYFEGA